MRYERQISNLREHGAITPCRVYNTDSGQNTDTFALIDTGGYASHIDNSLITLLNLTTKGTVPVKGTAATHIITDFSTFHFSVSIIRPQESEKFFIESIQTDLSTELYKIVLGRDFLQHCTFIYSGKDNQFFHLDFSSAVRSSP